MKRRLSRTPELKQPSALSRKIVRILARHGIEWPGGEENAYVARTRAGWSQRAAGAWSWWLAPVSLEPGAHYPAVAGYGPASLIRDTWSPHVERGAWIFDAPEDAATDPNRHAAIGEALTRKVGRLA